MKAPNKPHQRRRQRYDAQKSEPLTGADKAIIAVLLELGFQHKRVAALFDVNQGRIAEAAKSLGIEQGEEP